MECWKERMEDMKDNLRMAKSVVEEDSLFQMEKYMKVNGRMIMKKGLEHIIMYKEQCIMDNGFKIKNMVKGGKYFQMDLHFKEHLRMESSKDKEYFNGEMELNMKGDL